MKDNNCGDDSSAFITYDGHLGDNIISGNTDLRGNSIIENRDFSLFYLHIGIHTGDKNTGYNKEKKKRSQISPFTKLY